jgi:hypothetical protein
MRHEGAYEREVTVLKSLQMLTDMAIAISAFDIDYLIFGVIMPQEHILQVRVSKSRNERLGSGEMNSLRRRAIGHYPSESAIFLSFDNLGTLFCPPSLPCDFM